ncbi:alpha/beta fold hydrolase [Erythrobacter sp. JK5]|uniref:alpha/beta fold hydrolase n=1 Tax=Erythrobacter sp. JK5 TaxID=2829500 RepID=UPI001BA4EB2F|nr:alpha/beta hydrolase [Erythrobacter sp. JK5]QUL36446.1 alpha/beta hydrolase [Erythrobacter sp. JK5]
MKWVLRTVLTLAAVLVVLFVIFRSPDTDADEMRAKYGGEPSQFVEIGDGLTVHLRDEGPRDGVPIILLHGSNADLHTWDPWAEALSGTYRVIRFDQVGHGLTGPDPNGDYTLASFVADIDEVADALEIDRFVLGGNSMGGSHTIGYAIAHPERLYGIVLVDAGGAPVKNDGGGNLGFTIARTPVINQVMRHITPRSLVEKSLRQSVSNQAIVTDEAIDRYWELLRFPGNRAASIERFSRGWTGFDAEQVSQIGVPALILWGAEDRLIPVAAGKWYDATLPDARLAIYPGIGHLPQEETPEAVADLQKWLLNLEFTNEVPQDNR